MAMLRDGTTVEGIFNVNSTFNAKSTTEATSKTVGAVKISGGLAVAKNIYGTYIYGDKVHGAVWNDIADFLEVPDDTIIEFGKVYTRSKDKVEQTSKVNQKAIGIASDTFGLSIGKKGKGKEIPIALGGWVLAYVDKVYDFGTELVATKNGRLTKASLITSMFRSNRVVAIYDRKEEMKEWNGVEVKERHWVKVK